MYKLFLTLRYLLHRRIVLVPIVAVMLCVAMTTIVVGLMGGFLDKLRGSVRGLFGDVIVSDGSLAGFGYYDAYTDADGVRHPGLIQYLDAISAGRQPTTQPELQELYQQPAVIRQATPVIEIGALLRLANEDRDGFTSLLQVVGIRPDEYARVTNFQDGLYWQRPGTPDPESTEPINAADRRKQAADARKAGDEAKAQMIEADLRNQTEQLKNRADLRRQYDWAGEPDFGKIPPIWNPGQPPVPLKTIMPNIDDPVGVIVGIRVFYPTADSQGRYRRQMLLPGAEKVQLTFMPISAIGTVADKPEMKQFYLVDTSFSHIPQIDRAMAYVPFDKLQEYLMMNASSGPVTVRDRQTGDPVGQFLAPARATRLLIKLADGVSLPAGREAVRKAVDAWTADRRKHFLAMPSAVQNRAVYYEPFGMDLASDMDVEVWEEANKEYFSAIAMQRSIAIVMVGIVSLTVIGLIWVIFIMIVVEKTKDIGIVKSVGGSAGGIASIFITWAAIIGAIGSALGGLLGWQFIRHINEIERWLSSVFSWLTGTEITLYDPRAYLFDSIPARFEMHEFLLVAVAAIVAAMIGALLPAWRAGRMNVVETLRYE